MTHAVTPYRNVPISIMNVDTLTKHFSEATVVQVYEKYITLEINEGFIYIDNIEPFRRILNIRYNPPKLIAIAGKKGSGKSTVANILSIKYNYTHIAFSDPLKQAAAALFQLTHEQLNDKKEEIDPRWGVSPREIMQFLGTDLIRNQCNRLIKTEETVFVANMRIRIEELLKQNGRVVISDLRFPDELKMLIDLGACLIHVDRHLVQMDEHPSEHALDDYEWEHRIINNGSLDHLHDAVDKLF